MAAQQTPTIPSESSSDAESPRENEILVGKDARRDSQDHYIKDQAGYDDIQYPETWKFEFY